MLLSPALPVWVELRAHSAVAQVCLAYHVVTKEHLWSCASHFKVQGCTILSWPLVLYGIQSVLILDHLKNTCTSGLFGILE